MLSRRTDQARGAGAVTGSRYHPRSRRSRSSPGFAQDRSSPGIAQDSEQGR